MMPYLTERFGNPHSANHAFGRDAADSVLYARTRIAMALGAFPEDVVFTSGATEANNPALQGLAFAPWQTSPRFIAAQTEHKSVLEPLDLLSRKGFKVALVHRGCRSGPLSVALPWSDAF